MRTSLVLAVTLSLFVFAAGPAAAEDGAQGAALDGAALYKANCATCHGEDGKGETKVGQKLGVEPITAKSGDELVEFIQSSDKHKSVAKKVTTEELQAIAAALPTGD